MFAKEYKLLIATCVCFSIFILVLLPDYNFCWDQWCWQGWAKFILEKGLGNAYTNPDINYSPVFLYFLRLFGKLTGTPDKIDANIRCLRLFVFIFDIGSVLLTGWVLKKQGINPLYALLILFNVAFLYNTLIWGQVDTIQTAFVAAAIIAALYRKAALSCCLFLLGYNMKLQAIVFLPIIGIILLPQFITEKKKIFYSLVSLLIVELLILYPFIRHGQVFNALSVGKRQMDYYPVVSMNADNIWRMIFPNKDVMKLSDREVFIGITYKTWGIVMFLISSGAALLPLCLRFWRRESRSTLITSDTYRLVFLVSTLIALDFFFFNTQMHERYSHPIVLFSGIYCLLGGSYYLYILLSISYLLNLERVMHHINLPNYNVLIMSPVFIAALFGVSLCFGYYKLYSSFSFTQALEA